MTGKFWKSNFFFSRGLPRRVYQTLVNSGYQFLFFSRGLPKCSNVPKTGKFAKSFFLLLAWCSGVQVIRRLVIFDRSTDPAYRVQQSRIVLGIFVEPTPLTSPYPFRIQLLPSSSSSSSSSRSKWAHFLITACTTTTSFSTNPAIQIQMEPLLYYYRASTEKNPCNRAATKKSHYLLLVFLRQ